MSTILVVDDMALCREPIAEALHGKGYDDPVSVEILSAPLRKLPLPEFAARLRRACAPYWG